MKVLRVCMEVYHNLHNIVTSMLRPGLVYTIYVYWAYCNAACQHLCIFYTFLSAHLAYPVADNIYIHINIHTYIISAFKVCKLCENAENGLTDIFLCFFGRNDQVKISQIFSYAPIRLLLQDLPYVKTEWWPRTL